MNGVVSVARRLVFDPVAAVSSRDALLLVDVALDCISIQEIGAVKGSKYRSSTNRTSSRAEIVRRASQLLQIALAELEHPGFERRYFGKDERVITA